MSNGEKVLDFMKLYKQSHNINIFDGQPATLHLLSLRQKLINEEIDELNNAVAAFVVWSRSRTGKAQNLQREAYIEIIDALTDILYVTYGFFHAFGVNPDAAFDIVHKSNLSKLSDDGKPIFRADGKVLKGPNYQPPNFDEIA